MKYPSHARVFIKDGNRLIHVSVISLSTRILYAPYYIKRYTDWAKFRPDGGVLLCESSVQVVWNVNSILARGESEKPNESTVERKLKLTRNQRRAKFKQAVMLRRGSSTGFSGYGISLIWSSGFGILNGGGFGIDGMLGRWDAKKPPRDYGIARSFGSGIRDWRTLSGTL